MSKVKPTTSQGRNRPDPATFLPKQGLNPNAAVDPIAMLDAALSKRASLKEETERLKMMVKKKRDEQYGAIVMRSKARKKLKKATKSSEASSPKPHRRTLTSQWSQQKLDQSTSSTVNTHDNEVIDLTESPPPMVIDLTELSDDDAAPPPSILRTRASVPLCRRSQSEVQALLGSPGAAEVEDSDDDMEFGEVVVSRREREPSPDAPSEEIKVFTPRPMRSNSLLADLHADPAVPEAPSSSTRSAPAKFRHRKSPVARDSHSLVVTDSHPSKDDEDEDVHSDDVGASAYTNDIEHNAFDDGPPDVDMPASSPTRAPSQAASSSRRSSAKPTRRTLSKSLSPVKPTRKTTFDERTLPATFTPERRKHAHFTPERESVAMPSSGPKWTCLSGTGASSEPEDQEEEEEEEIDELDPD